MAFQKRTESKPSTSSTAPAAFKEVYTIIDRGENQKAYWLRIGTCWTNKDGSFNVNLDALPVNGKLNIRDKKEWDNEEKIR